MSRIGRLEIVIEPASWEVPSEAKLYAEQIRFRCNFNGRQVGGCLPLNPDDLQTRFDFMWDRARDMMRLAVEEELRRDEGETLMLELQRWLEERAEKLKLGVLAMREHPNDEKFEEFLDVMARIIGIPRKELDEIMSLGSPFPRVQGNNKEEAAADASS